MDSRKQSLPPDAAGTKGAFRKPNNDAGNRKYRRRSPVSGSSSPDGSPKRGRSSSPISSKEDSAKVSEHRQRRNDDRREVDRDYGRSQYGKGGDVHRYSDRQSSRSSHGSSRHDDYLRGSDHGRPRDYSRNSDKYSRDRYDGSDYRSKDKDNETSSLERSKYKDSLSDRTGSGRRHPTLDVDETENNRTMRERDSRDEKRDHRRSSGDHKSDLTRTYEESKERHNDSTLERDSSGKRFKDAFKNDTKEHDVEKVGKWEKKHDEREPNKKKDWYGRETGDKFEDKSVYANKDQESQSKKPKIFSPEKSTDYVKVSKFSEPVADDKHLSTSKQAQEADGKLPAGQTNSAETLTANDINAAKVAAMKAAELVNRNIVGGGYLSTDQKKKLLWGNKKSSAAEESGHRWDASLFGDRERQEKFNKLMSLRLPYLWRIVGCEGRREGRSEIQQPGGRRGEAEGTPAGLGEAIHCWIKAKRRAHCRFGPLRTCLGFYCTLEATGMCCILLYFLLHVEIMLCYLKVEIFEKSHHAHNLLVARLFCNLHLLFASYFWIEDRE